MANRLTTNFYIVDTATGNIPLPYGLQGTSAAVATTANIGKMKVIDIIFIANDTTATAVVAVGNTGNVIASYGFLFSTSPSNIMWNKTQVDHFGIGIPTLGVYVPTMTASTLVFVLE